MGRKKLQYMVRIMNKLMAAKSTGTLAYPWMWLLDREDASYREGKVRADVGLEVLLLSPFTRWHEAVGGWLRFVVIHLLVQC